MTEGKKAKKLIGLLVLVFLILLPALNTQAATLKMNYKKKIMLVGDTCKLRTNASNNKVTFKSGNRKIASVSKSGEVKAKKAGKVVISATYNKKKCSCIVVVKDTVDVIIFAGQSNMTGAGNASMAPKLTDCAGLAYHPVTNKKQFTPIEEPFGRGEDDNYFYNGDFAQGSMVTSFVNHYYSKTKTPVIAVPAAYAGSGSVSWAGGPDVENPRYLGVINRIKGATNLAKKKGFTIRHTYMVWMQGENDAFARMNSAKHKANIKSLYKNISAKTALEAIMVIQIPSYYNGSYFNGVDMGFDIGKRYEAIQKAQLEMCQEDPHLILISQKAATIPKSQLKEDGIHLEQSALNQVGKDAGLKAAAYANSH